MPRSGLGIKKALRWAKGPFSVRKKEKELGIKTPFMERFSKLRPRERKLRVLVMRSHELLQARRKIRSFMRAMHIPSVSVGYLEGLGEVTLSEYAILHTGRVLQELQTKKLAQVSTTRRGNIQGEHRLGEVGRVILEYDGKKLTVDLSWQNKEDKDHFIRDYGAYMKGAIREGATALADFGTVRGSPEHIYEYGPGKHHLQLQINLDPQYVRQSFEQLIQWAELEEKVKAYAIAHRGKNAKRLAGTLVPQHDVLHEERWKIIKKK